MLFRTPDERSLGQAVAQLVAGNPFLPERLAAEQASLGAAFDPAGTLWHSPPEPEPAPNQRRLAERVTPLVETLRERLAASVRPTPAEAATYEALVFYHLYDQAQARLFALVHDAAAEGPRVAAWEPFQRGVAQYLAPWPETFPSAQHPGHLFACAFQVRRAFHHVFSHILGESPPAMRLRAAVWQSIFTHDLARYRRALYTRLGDVPTLILGPTGTGKGLVARAIALSRYIPFDAGRGAFADSAAAFVPLNLSALSPTLLEAELFGHRKGAFTGALGDRIGWLERCPAPGTVFLDEIGEVDPAVQVKLLRVLQTRTFQRLGDDKDRRFAGKLVAATNRDLTAAMAAGRFRQDFYYRLCADVIETPSLAERLRAAPAERHTLVVALAHRIAGPEEGPGLAAETEAWIERALPPGYSWPGNVRELEQCTRNVLIRGSYTPRTPPALADRRALVDAVLAGGLTAEALVRRYCTLVYAETGNYAEVARRLGLDRRTARDRVDQDFLRSLRLPVDGDGRDANGHLDGGGAR
jgi:DNA-binding NtrC family response regulator